VGFLIGQWEAFPMLDVAERRAVANRRRPRHLTLGDMAKQEG